MFMVQTRSQAKCVKAPAKGKSACSTWKKVKDIKPIIIEDYDDQDILNMNKDNVVTNKDVPSHINPQKHQIKFYITSYKAAPQASRSIRIKSQGHSTD